MMAEDPDVQKAEDATEDVKNNQFIQSCDIRWISMFERMVGILPDPLASIEERRRRVLEKWRAAAPYNYAGLIRQLNGLCWNEGYAIRPDFPEYKIEILVGGTGTNPRSGMDLRNIYSCKHGCENYK